METFFLLLLFRHLHWIDLYQYTLPLISKSMLPSVLSYPFRSFVWFCTYYLRIHKTTHHKIPYGWSKHIRHPSFPLNLFRYWLFCLFTLNVGRREYTQKNRRCKTTYGCIKYIGKGIKYIHLWYYYILYKTLTLYGI